MLHTVIRLFHSFVSLTLASGIIVKAIQSRGKVLHKHTELFCEKNEVPPSLQSYVRIVNKITARSLQAGICSTQLGKGLLFFLISHLCDYGQQIQDLKLGETVRRENSRGNKNPVTEGIKKQHTKAASEKQTNCKAGAELRTV